MNLQGDEKTCPLCFEVIKKQALRCKHCNADLTSGRTEGATFGTWGGAQGVAIGGTGHHIEGGLHVTTTLAELDGIDEGKKRQLLALYESKVRDFPENAKYQVALGLSYLDLRLYDLALATLKRALGKGTNEVNLYYYIALASIQGKRPRVLSFAKIKEIESYLEAASHLNARCGHVKVLWAIVKYSYYLPNGLRINSPTVEELLSSARQTELSTDELRLMLTHVDLPPDLRSAFA
jgi:hypothetical protein